MRAKVGDVFEIPLSNNYFCVGIVLYKSKYFHQGIIAALFDKCYEVNEIIDTNNLPNQLIDVPNYVNSALLNKGVWPIVGQNEVMAQKISIPELAVSSNVFVGDTVVRKLSNEEIIAKKVTNLTGQGRFWLEKKLRHHFQLPEPSETN